MPIGNGFKGAVLNGMLGDNHTSEFPNTVYYAYYSAPPTDAGGGTELIGDGYERTSTTNNSTNFPDSASDVKTNGNTVLSSVATADWDIATHWAIHGHLTNDDIITWGELAAPVTNLSGQRIVVDPGELTITLTTCP